MKLTKLFGVLALSGALIAQPAFAAGYFTPGLPLISNLTGSEQIPLDTEYANGISPQSAGITTSQLASGLSGLAGSSQPNGLIGGDFGTNPWQRGTTSADISSTLTYTADRWWELGGASSAINVSKQTGAGDISQAYAASLRFARKAANTDTAAICLGQVLTSANSTRFQGQLTEFVFHSLAGANFSSANSYVNVTIGYGTGSDQSAASFAAGTWTGYAAAVTSSVPISTSWGRYSAVGTIPATATQVGVKICFTPVGTAGANDWFELTGAMLDVNPGAVALTGASGVGSARSFIRQDTAMTLQLAQGYFWRLAEPASTAAIDASCQAVGASTNICNVNLPVVMRAIPTIVITTAGTFKVNIAGTPTTIATPTASVCSTKSCAVTAANTNTAGQTELLSGGGGTGAWDVSAEL